MAIIIQNQYLQQVHNGTENGVQVLEMLGNQAVFAIRMLKELDLHRILRIDTVFNHQ